MDVQPLRSPKWHISYYMTVLDCRSLLPSAERLLQACTSTRKQPVPYCKWWHHTVLHARRDLRPSSEVESHSFPASTLLNSSTSEVHFTPMISLFHLHPHSLTLGFPHVHRRRPSPHPPLRRPLPPTNLHLSRHFYHSLSRTHRLPLSKMPRRHNDIPPLPHLLGRQEPRLPRPHVAHVVPLNRHFRKRRPVSCYPSCSHWTIDV